jgi:hypothetical protein
MGMRIQRVVRCLGGYGIHGAISIIHRIGGFES